MAQRSVKYLGLNLDDQLTGVTIVNIIVQKGNGMLNFLYRQCSFLEENPCAWHLFYVTLIMHARVWANIFGKKFTLALDHTLVSVNILCTFESQCGCGFYGKTTSSESCAWNVQWSWPFIYIIKSSDVQHHPSKHLKAGHHRPASLRPFEWRFASGPMVARHYVLTGTSLEVVRSHTFMEIDHEIISHSSPFRWIIQEGLLSITSKSMCTKYWLTACSSLPRKKVWLGGLIALPWPQQ